MTCFFVELAADRSFARLRATSLLVVSTSLWLQGCEGSRAREASADGVVLYAGCLRERAGHVCEIDKAEGRLTLWRSTTFRDARVSIGGHAVPTSDAPVGGGYQLEIPSKEFGSLGQEFGVALIVAQNEAPVFNLRVVEHRPTAELSEAIAAKDGGQIERAHELISTLEDRSSNHPEDAEARLEAILARGLKARLTLRTGAPQEAAAVLAETAEALSALGQLSEAARDVVARAFILARRLNQVDAAEDWVAAWRQRLSASPLARALLVDNEAMLALSRDQPLAAFRRYRDAELMYERLGEKQHARRVAKEQVMLLGSMGDTRAALDRLDALGAPSPTESSCNAADFYELRAWLSLQEARAGDPEIGESVARELARASDWQRRCRDPVTRSLGIIDQGLWSLRAGDLPGARAQLVELDQVQRNTVPEMQALASITLSTWQAELRGRIALADGHNLIAQEQFGEQLRLADAFGQLDAGLRAHLGLAEVARARGDDQQAEQELRRALQRLERAERWASFGSLVYTQLATRQDAARELVQRLAQRGEGEAAFALALRTYAAALRLQARRASAEAAGPASRQAFESTLARYRSRRDAVDADARADWGRSAHELAAARQRRAAEQSKLEELLEEALRLVPESAQDGPPTGPARGQYWLIFVPPVNYGGPWFAIGSDGSSVNFAELAAEALFGTFANEATHPALAPFANALQAAREIVIFPASRARQLPFEKWQLDGSPLRQRRIAFGVGLPPSARSGDTDGTLALVIGDPTQDLPFARQEALLAAATLAANSNQVLIGAQASAEVFRQQLPHADILHFAGHVRRSRRDAEPSLVLADGAIDTWDLLSLGRVPGAVVLSACRAGDSTEVGQGAGFGLAQAMLALGADFVVAPVDMIDDREALRFHTNLYAQLQSTGDMREAFWLTEAESTSESAFRLYVR